VVLLDEPFEGLDPVTSRALKGILNRLRERGVTLVLTSHVLDVVERLCPDVAIIHEGRLCARGAPDAIAREHGVASLEDAFIRIVGAPEARSLSWS
jgi:ABC-2 type transport system ATP-binding protein